MVALGCQRAEFSLPDGLHYLNCAYMSPLSNRVEEAGLAGLRRKRDPTGIEPADFFEDGNRIRELFGRLVGAPADRIAIVPSASYGIAVAARNLAVGAGQNIVIAGEQFPSNVYAWHRRALESGAELRTVPRPQGPPWAAAWNAALCDAIDTATAVVALPEVHWTDGTRFDLAALGARAREVGAALVVDGTQSVGALPFDVQRVRPDALVCAAYKWLLGPYGIGVAYYGSRLDGGTPIEEPWIVRQGSEDFRRLVDYQDGYRAGALRYDAGGMSNFITVPMLRAALEQLLGWGVEAIQAYCARLVEPLIAEAERCGWAVERANGRAAHIVGIRLPGSLDLGRLQAVLRERRVVASLRGESLRVSPHVYNDAGDVAALLEALDAGW